MKFLPLIARLQVLAALAALAPATLAQAPAGSTAKSAAKSTAKSAAGGDAASAPRTPTPSRALSKAPSRTPRDPLFAELRPAILKGDYDTVIDTISARLAKDQARDSDQAGGEAQAQRAQGAQRAQKQATLPEELAYLRGRAAYFLGSYDLAQSDLAPLGDWRPWPRWTPASEYVSKIGALQALMPPLVYEVKQGARVVFRVHYTEDNAFTRGLIALLPAAYEANCQMLGVRLFEIPVYIFNRYEDYSALYALFGNGSRPGNWSTASGLARGFYFSRLNAQGRQKYNDPNSVAFRSVVAHELNHCLALRLTGTTRPPLWMLEGLAEVAGSYLSPQKIAQNDRRMSQVAASGQILPLAQANRFRDTIEGNAEAGAQGQAVPDPYAQGFHMTRAFLSLLVPDGLPEFLRDVRDSQDFGATFQKHTGQAVPQFYNNWRQSLGAQAPARP